MGSLTQNLQALATAKENLRVAINAKGGSLSTAAKLSSFTGAVQNLPVGGNSGDEENSHLVRFFDYDGTLLKIEHIPHGGNATAPTVPTHPRLEFTEWNRDYNNITYPTDIGAVYKPSSANEIFSQFPQDGEKLLVECDVAITPKNVYKSENERWNEETQEWEYSETKIKQIILNFTASVAVLGKDRDEKLMDPENAPRYTIYWGDGTSETVQLLEFDENLEHTFTRGVTYQKKHVYEDYGFYTIQLVGFDTTLWMSSDFATTGNWESYENGEIIRAYIYGVESVSLGSSNSIQELVLCNVNTINSFAIGLRSLTALVIPRGATLADNIFEECESLQTVVLSDQQYIPPHCFNGCINLQNVTIPANIKGIGNRAFQNCKLLKEVFVPDGTLGIGEATFFGCEKLLKARLPEGITQIKFWLFTDCVSLQKVNIPSTITTIEPYAFQNCQRIEELNLHDNITTIGERVFVGCVSLKSIHIPIGITKITTAMFTGSGLQGTFEIPDHITEIQNSAFEGCVYLKKIIIPSSVTKIGGYVFRGLLLDEIIIPDTVTEIGERIFESAKFIKWVTIPKFAYCMFNSVGTILNIHLTATVPPEMTAYENLPRLYPNNGCKFHVPYSVDHSVLNAYINAPWWSDYALQIVEFQEDE